MKVRPMSQVIGAEILGLNLSGGIDDAQFVAVHQAWLEPPELLIISNLRKNARPIGGLGNLEAAWHTDMSYNQLPLIRPNDS